MMKNEIKIIVFDMPNKTYRRFMTISEKGKILEEKNIYNTEYLKESSFDEMMLSKVSLRKYENHFPEGYYVTFEGRVLYKFNPEKEDWIKTIDKKIEELERLEKFVNIAKSPIILKAIDFFLNTLRKESIYFHLNKLNDDIEELNNE